MRPVATLLALLTIALLTIAHIRGPQPQAAPRARPRATPILPLSVEATRQTDLHAAPGRKGRFVGTLARGTRVPILGEARGGQCKGGRWLEVSRGAWMCADHGRLTWRFPRGARQPLVREGSLVPRRDYYARRDGVLRRNLASVCLFRLMPFWGTYRGYHQRSPVTERLRQTFYYPTVRKGQGQTEFDWERRPIKYKEHPAKEPIDRVGSRK